MCFGASRSGEHSPHARPVELQPQIPIRRVRPLEDLEYYALGLLEGDNPMFDQGTGHLINFFIIWHRNEANEDRHIAILGGCPEMGLLIVNEIYTGRDPRRKGIRPLAADIFLSFWHFSLKQPIEALRILFLDTVQEDTMKDARPHVYGLMRRTHLGEKLIVRRWGDLDGETDAFNLTYHGTKFGKCGKTMENENEVMRAFRIKVSGFEFVPRDFLGNSFHVKVFFEVDPSYHHQQVVPSDPHQHHRGHRRRR